MRLGHVGSVELLNVAHGEFPVWQGTHATHWCGVAEAFVLSMTQVVATAATPHEQCFWNHRRCVERIEHFCWLARGVNLDRAFLLPINGGLRRMEAVASPGAVARGEQVYVVNPRWTAQRRRRARKQGKCHRLHAHAVAQLVREEGATLPQVPLAETAVLALLTTACEAALLMPRLHNHRPQVLLQTAPDDGDHPPSLTTEASLRVAEIFQGTVPRPWCSTEPPRSDGLSSACGWRCTKRMSSVRASAWCSSPRCATH